VGWKAAEVVGAGGTEASGRAAVEVPEKEGDSHGGDGQEPEGDGQVRDREPGRIERAEREGTVDSHG